MTEPLAASCSDIWSGNGVRRFLLRAAPGLMLPIYCHVTVHRSEQRRIRVLGLGRAETEFMISWLLRLQLKRINLGFKIKYGDSTCLRISDLMLILHRHYIIILVLNPIRRVLNLVRRQF